MAKHYTLRFAKKDEKIFRALKSGAKRVETRAASVRYERIAEGDEIAFVCGAEKFSRVVAKASVFKTPNALFRKYAPEDVLPGVVSRKELLALWHRFPGYEEKIAQYGLIALEFKRPRG